MNSGKLIAGVLAGVATGAVMGILFAPEKGSKIRKRFLRRGDNSTENLKEKFDDFYESIVEKFETSKLKAKEILIPKRKPIINEVNKDFIQAPSS